MTHARLGHLARWFCNDCTVDRYVGRFPCTHCCGYTTSPDKVARGVRTAWGQRNARCVP